jgi:hypothetical protein
VTTQWEFGLFGLLLAAGVFVGMLVLLEVGRRIGQWRAAMDPDAPRVEVGAMDGAVFALLGLLIAFTFASAASRFDTRRQLAVEEANAIGTAYLRLDVLPPDAQPALREQFRQYVDARIAAYRSFPDLSAVKAELARAVRLQGEIWAQAVAASRGEGTQSARIHRALVWAGGGLVPFGSVWPRIRWRRLVERQQRPRRQRVGQRQLLERHRCPWRHRLGQRGDLDRPRRLRRQRDTHRRGGHDSDQPVRRDRDARRGVGANDRDQSIRGQRHALRRRRHDRDQRLRRQCHALCRRRHDDDRLLRHDRLPRVRRVLPASGRDLLPLPSAHDRELLRILVR